MATDDIKVHLFKPTSTSGCGECGYGISHVVHSAVEQADEAAVAFHGCCISAPHRGECVEPQADATCPHSFKHTENDGTRYCSTCGDVIPPRTPDTSLSLLDKQAKMDRSNGTSNATF